MTVNSKVRVAKVRSEETSAAMASLAGRILKALENIPGGRGLYHINVFAGAVCTVTELRSLAASALNAGEGQGEAMSEHDSFEPIWERLRDRAWARKEAADKPSDAGWCAGITKIGLRCTHRGARYPHRGRMYCKWHNPERAKLKGN